jgi:hypothetical protein
MDSLKSLPNIARSRSATFNILIACLILGILYILFFPSHSTARAKSPFHPAFRDEEPRWIPHTTNPILPDFLHSPAIGKVFDISVLYDEDQYKMYVSWRYNGTISYSTSSDGITWNQELQFSLGGEPEHQWEEIVNRPFVLKRATGEYIMWYVPFSHGMSVDGHRYTGQRYWQPQGGQIGMANSTDGIEFTKIKGNAHGI